MYARTVIIHRQRPIGALPFLLAALLTVPFALGGSTWAWLVAVIVWAGAITLLVRRHKTREKRDRPPPSAI
jgi:O-antigen/teichoic acid export membrane protein